MLGFWVKTEDFLNLSEVKNGGKLILKLCIVFIQYAEDFPIEISM